MNVFRISRWCIVPALLAASVTLVSNRAFAVQPSAPDAEDGVEVLTRGPVHEAFAETVTFNPEPGIVVPKAPPEAIEEVPPDQRLAGDNVTWIPGYWAWDDERSDFLWVSGIWRNLPPGRQWVPGYWGESGQEFQWTSGYWADATESEVEYLPEPPASVEEGPSIAASTPDQSWIPGYWQWRQTGYVWRPGYWASAQPNWIWVPAYYAWAPRGYVFVNGYWDYPVARRGVLFAPVYFDSGIRSQRGYSYSPVTVISPTAVVSHLFLRPRYGHYYFGDYYAANYTGLGFAPWFTFQSSRYGYDPFYAHQRWHNRNDRQWNRRVEADFKHRRDHEEARPPRTWTAQRALARSQVNSADKIALIAESVDQLAKRKDSPLRFQPVAKEEQQRLAQQGQEMRKFRQERQKLEAKAAVTSAAKPSKPTDASRAKLQRSPIAARSADQRGKDQAQPMRREVLKPDVKIKPKPRTTVESKSTPKVAPKSRTKVAPKSSTKVAPRPTAKVAPTSGAKVQRQLPNRAQTNRSAQAPAKGNRPDVTRRAPTRPDVTRAEPRLQRRVERSQPQPRIDRPAPLPRMNRSAPQPQTPSQQNKPKDNLKDKN
jgi:hypothetical protein